MSETLAGQIGVVTGASSGIGRAIAVRLASRGVDVWLLARREDELDATAAAVRRAGARAWSCPLDLCSDAELERFRDRVQGECAGVDILAHSAGTHVFGTVADAPVSELDVQYRVNVRGPYLLTQLLLPLLLPRRGQVVFVNSSAGLQSRARVGGYAASKHALRALADALRDEVNAAGVRVLSIYPGRTATPQQAAIHAAEEKPYHPDRLMRPEDVASAVVHALCAERTTELTDIRLRPMQKA